MSPKNYWGYPCNKCHQPAFFIKEKPKSGVTLGMGDLLVLVSAKWQTTKRLCCQFCGLDPRPTGVQKVDTNLMETFDVHAEIYKIPEKKP